MSLALNTNMQHLPIEDVMRVFLPLRYLQAMYVSLRKLKNQRQSVGTNLGSPRRGRKLDVIV